MAVACPGCVIGARICKPALLARAADTFGYEVHLGYKAPSPTELCRHGIVFLCVVRKRRERGNYNIRAA
jgi:hypothetical protein